MKKTALAALAFCTMLSPVFTAQAADYVTGYIGWHDFIDDEESSAEFGAEYRFHPFNYGIRPTLGLYVTSEGAAYGYGGINWEVPLVDNEVYLIPNFMVGAYGEGDGKDLGGAIEFRSGVEIAYQMPNQHRVGLAINHISNASIYDKNPGAETILINYSIPVGQLF
ncbi:MAG: acyloxyacyl hydrolase [Alphaproteobacteria bacterium]